METSEGEELTEMCGAAETLSGGLTIPHDLPVDREVLTNGSDTSDERRMREVMAVRLRWWLLL